ncbi:MAG TPA: hypothetical protein VHT49_06775 [Acidimicrobiales bacterium]|nr:hypothetical protein [Acidimicrobiales bacterium]
MLPVLLVILVVVFIVLPIIGLAIGAVISAVVVGLVIGALGRLVIPGRQSIGLLATLMLGLIGSIVGSFVGRHILHIGSLSLLLEIGIAAVAVALYAASPAHRRSLSSGSSGPYPVDRR